MMRDGSTADDGQDRDVGEESWTPAEQALLDAALEFYDAAEGVIDYARGARLQVRHDAAGFEAVRRAMGLLEERVAEARTAGIPPEQIARITRIEQETILLILERRDAAPSRSDG